MCNYWQPPRPFILMHFVNPSPPPSRSPSSWVDRHQSCLPCFVKNCRHYLPQTDIGSVHVSGRFGGALANFWNHVGCSSPTVTHGRTICFPANYHKNINWIQIVWTWTSLNSEKRCCDGEIQNPRMKFTVLPSEASWSQCSVNTVMSFLLFFFLA